MRRSIAAVAVMLGASALVVPTASAHESEDSVCGYQNSATVDTGTAADDVQVVEGRQTYMIPGADGNAAYWIDDRDYTGMRFFFDFAQDWVVNFAVNAAKGEIGWSDYEYHDHSGGLWIHEETTGDNKLQRGGNAVYFRQIENDYPDVADAVDIVYSELYGGSFWDGDDPCTRKGAKDAVIF